ncbi:MAG: hypothetical protein ACJ8I9_00525 [Chthoniobacterales bacterium]
MRVARQLLERFEVKNLASLAAILALFTGCSSTGTHAVSKSDGKVYAVTAENADFFRVSPQQGNGPDRTLPRNTLVRLIRPSWGFSKVQVLDDNQQGYIATDDISAAPAKLVASANTTKADATPQPSATAEQFDLNSTDPQLSAPPESLPPPDLPSATDVALPPAPSPSGQ